MLEVLPISTNIATSASALLGRREVDAQGKVYGREVEFAAANGPIKTQSDGDALAGTPRMVVDALSPIPVVVG